MNFSDLLSGYIGRTVEAFLENQFYTGVLVSVQDGSFTLQITDTTYTGIPIPITIFNIQVVYVRILD
jgi:hypothetical protein